MSSRITIIENGPALIQPPDGDYVVVEGKDFHHIGGIDKVVAICRCGKSNSKILCDGSHSKKLKTEEV